jgi:bacterioferritin
MKGSPKVITVLNTLLAGELAAVNQYMVHAKMCENWGYKRLMEYFEKRAIEEMGHAETEIDRILFLEGQPIVSSLDPINIGFQVEGMLTNDRASEVKAVIDYNAAIAICVSERDNGTREIMETILHDEERHVNDLEESLDQISHMGINMFLAEQMK